MTPLRSRSRWRSIARWTRRGWAAAFTLDDGQFLDGRYRPDGPVTMIDPVTARVGLVYLDGITTPGVHLTVGAENGVVAVDDGGVWAGVTNLALPFG